MRCCSTRARVAYDGPVAGALSAYHAALEAGGGLVAGEPAGAQVQASLLDAAGEEARHFEAGGQLRVRVHVTFDEEVSDPLIGVMVAPLGMGASYSINTTPGSYAGTHGPGRPLDAEVTLTNRMLDGSYSVWVGVHTASGGRQLGCTEPMVFYVSSHQTQARGVIDLEAHITVGGREIAQPGRQRLGGRVSLHAVRHRLRAAGRLGRRAPHWLRC